MVSMAKKNLGGRPKELDGETCRFSVYLESALVKRLKKIAVKRGCSLSELIRDELQIQLALEDKKKARKRS